MMCMLLKKILERYTILNYKQMMEDGVCIKQYYYFEAEHMSFYVYKCFNTYTIEYSFNFEANKENINSAKNVTRNDFIIKENFKTQKELLEFLDSLIKNRKDVMNYG